ncbi:hypothetical protein D3C76_1347110 [compost metagenome]
MMSSRSSDTRRQIGAVSPDYRSHALFDDSDTVAVASNSGFKYGVWPDALEVMVVGPKEKEQT